MGGVPHDRRVMEKQSRLIDVEALVEEIQRYLAVVDAFRAEGYKPGQGAAKGEGMMIAST